MKIKNKHTGKMASAQRWNLSAVSEIIVGYPDGRCICKICGKKYNEHPNIMNSPNFRGLCNGDYVKL